MEFEDVKLLVVGGLGIVSTFIAVKKDWITSQFVRKDKALEQAATNEAVEAAMLTNIETEINIYRGIVADLKREIMELRDFVQEQKDFIQEQARVIERYKKKCGPLDDK